MDRTPSRSLGRLISAAAENAAASAVLAQLDALHARETGDREGEIAFLGEMRAYREMAGALVGICRENLEA